MGRHLDYTLPSANTVICGPVSGSLAAATYRALTIADGATGTGTVFTQGSVVLAGASGIYTQDNANLFWDATNHRLGIGTAVPGTKLVISGNAAAPPTPFADTTVQVMGANSTNPGLTFNSFASGYWPGLYGSHANGTGASPTGCVVDDVLFRMAG